jgi:hypothetical protein
VLRGTPSHNNFSFFSVTIAIEVVVVMGDYLVFARPIQKYNHLFSTIIRSRDKKFGFLLRAPHPWEGGTKKNSTALAFATQPTIDMANYLVFFRALQKYIHLSSTIILSRDPALAFMRAPLRDLQKNPWLGWIGVRATRQPR